MKISLLIFILIISAMAGCTANESASSLSFGAMDTACTITVYGAAEGQLEHMRDTVLEYDKIFSAHNGGEIGMLNANESGYFKLSEMPLRLLERCMAWEEETNGLFSCTLFNVSSAWEEALASGRLPDMDYIASLPVGAGNILISDEGVLLPVGMALDFGAVLKGHLLDVLLEGLDKPAIISLGGSIGVSRQKPGGEWNVGVAHPSGNGLIGTIKLAPNKKVSTSGDYQRFYEVDGTRYCHIIHPEEKAPANSGVNGVSIISDNGALTDVLSTALFVSGVSGAREILNNFPGTEAMLISSDTIWVTPGMKNIFTLEDANYILKELP